MVLAAAYSGTCYMYARTWRTLCTMYILSLLPCKQRHGSKKGISPRTAQPVIRAVSLIDDCTERLTKVWWSLAVAPRRPPAPPLYVCCCCCCCCVVGGGWLLLTFAVPALTHPLNPLTHSPTCFSLTFWFYTTSPTSHRAQPHRRPIIHHAFAPPTFIRCLFSHIAWSTSPLPFICVH